MKLKDKTCVVTGSSQGIGRAVAIGYAREGANVVLNYYSDAGPDTQHANRRRAEQTLIDVREYGTDAILVEADVSRADDVEQLFERGRAAFGPIDVLVNNAGIYPAAPWNELSESLWDRVLAVNLKGAFLCTQAATQDMVPSRYGKIINVSSSTFLLGTHTGFSHYISSKGGIIGLTRALARELGQYNVHVNAITPGAIQTETELVLYPDQEDLTAYLFERQCLKRRGTPADIVGTFVFLASHESDFITGQTINVDGGWAMH